MTVELLARVGGALLEGPAWDAAHDRVLFVDIPGRRRHAMAWTSGTLTTWDEDETTATAWIPRSSGGTVVAERRGIRLADDDGDGPVALEIEADRHGNRSNDAKCDPAGRLWLGTMAEDETPGAGSLYRVDPDLRCARVLTDLTVSNGLGWSADGRQMYFVDSPTRRVDVLDYALDDGTASGRRALTDTSAFAGSPDGLTIDVEGCLWVAMYGGGSIHRFAPDGRHLASIGLPAERVTSCCFAGPGLDRLVITTARDETGSGGDLFVADAGVGGTPTVAFAG